MLALLATVDLGGLGRLSFLLLLSLSAAPLLAGTGLALGSGLAVAGALALAAKATAGGSYQARPLPPCPPPLPWS